MPRLTIAELGRDAQAGKRLPMVTCYDYSSAVLCEKAGLRLLLVGDSLGQVILGHPDTLGVTLEDMVRHTAAVVRGAPSALVVADLPFLTYGDPAQALASAKRLVQEGGAQAVKLEGGDAVLDSISKLVGFGVPVIGHLGFTPQSVNQIGVRVQGRDVATAEKLIRAADAVAQAGALAIVLELVPAELAAAITRRVGVPTIGIGAGAGCSGQVQVWHDVLGISQATYRHAGRYAEAGARMEEGLVRYADAVRDGAFPTAAHAAAIDEAIIAEAIQRADRG